MASISELQDALINADKAGDTEAAKQLADAIYSAQGTQGAKPQSVQAGGVLNDVGRQLGLTARYGMEGLANTAQIATEPVRYATDRLTGNVGNSKPLGAIATGVADWMGLPKPQGANERVIGDATRLLAGSGGILGLGNAAAKVPGMIGAAGKALSQAPVSQLASATGSGLAGGASREAGGSNTQQVMSAVLGGLGGFGAASAAGSLATKATQLKNGLMTPLQMDGKISGILQKAGVDYSKVPEKIRQTMRAELADALKANKELNPTAVARLLDFKANNLTPTRGMVSLDPVQITREQNLAKMAANSSDDQLHGLPRIQNRNNAQLITNMNEAGANAGNVDAAGNLVTSSVLGRRDALRNAEQSAWTEAKGSPGYTQPISSKVISDINTALGDEGMMPFMNSTISKYMEAFQTGQPFTPQAYRNLQSMLAREVSKGGNEGAAAGLARRILEQSDLQPAGFANAGNALVTPKMAGAMQAADGNATDAIAAVNNARKATRQAYAYEDSSPLVRSVLSDGATSDPQRIAQRFVIGGTFREAQDMARQVGPEGISTIKNALVNHLKDKALNGASDEIGKFSQSTFAKELSALRRSGKLDLFFSKPEIEQLESMGRAASYMQVQPVGSAVNNSSSGALMLGKGLDWINSAAKKIPGGQTFVADPLRNIEISLNQRQAQNVLPGLLEKNPNQSLLGSFVTPSIAMGGLLAPQMGN